VLQSIPKIKLQQDANLVSRDHSSKQYHSAANAPHQAQLQSQEQFNNYI
jgi:hypothetical protein